MSTRTRFTVHSYNLLSSHLSEADYFLHCQPKNCLPEIRFPRILEILQNSIKQNAILALQEVSRDWAGDLHVFFAEHDYTMIDSLYGGRKNGYMGVAIAYPRQHYTLNGCEISRIADRLSRPRLEAGALQPAGPLTGWFGWMKSFFVSEPTAKWEAPNDPWEISCGRYNTAIWTLFQAKETQEEFAVATYHMPCAFWCPPVMTIHMLEVIRHCQALSAGKRLVVAGDFNVMPSSSQYRMVTTGIANPEDKADVPPPNGQWSAVLAQPMNSAYAAVHGEEPSFTNRAGVESQFTETLDYLFYSHESLRALSTVDLPTVEETPFMPNDTQPSDHLLVGATFECL